MVAWVRSKASLRSQTHASPPALAAIRLTSRRRTGSASAFSSGATCSACAVDIGVPVSGVQQASRVAHRRLLGLDIAVHHNDSHRIDKHRCLVLTWDQTSTSVDALPRGGTMSRVQLALRVADLEAAVAFYSRLFDAVPAKRRPGYANFAIAEPPLKLVLLEGEAGEPTRMDHLGVEVPSTDEVTARPTRLADAGLATRVRTTPPAATPSRTRCGSPAPAASRGRSTP
jgi:hypothetical protein